MSPRSIFDSWKSRYSNLLIDHRQVIAGRVLEPRDVHSVIAMNAFGVGLQLAVVMFEGDTARLQLIDGTIDVLDREIHNGERGRRVIRFGIHKRLVTATDFELQTLGRLADRQPELLTVK